jgi:peptidoglycan/xylan/chitin deacetylase (PgdA/CDA1 family)
MVIVLGGIEKWKTAGESTVTAITEHYAAAERRIAITFDDGPNPVSTVKLLEGLRERGVHATFFLIGSEVEQYPEVVKQMAEDGHLIGCHTYSHVQLTAIGLNEACEEVEAANQAIFEACGRVVTYIRPPYGLWSDALNGSMELTKVGWTIDPEDWKVLNTKTVTEHVVSRAEDGAIILLHDIYDTSVEAAFAIIDRLQTEGWEFVTVDELILD